MWGWLLLAVRGFMKEAKKARGIRGNVLYSPKQTSPKTETL
jgi:hypothetical protein